MTAKQRIPEDLSLDLEVTDLAAASATSSIKEVDSLCGLGRGPEAIHNLFLIPSHSQKEVH